MPNAKNLTTISITKSNYEILKDLGKTGESFNDVITRLVKSKNKEVVGEPTQQPDSRRESTTTPELKVIIVNGK